MVKELHLSLLRIEESNLGILIEESVTMEIETTNNETTNNTMKQPNTIDPDAEEYEDITFPIDSAGIDDLFDSVNEDDNSMTEDVEINIGNINIPADISSNNDNTLNANDPLIIYHQKLESKCKEIKELIGATIQKE